MTPRNLVTGCAVAALVLARPAALLTQPVGHQARALWPRALLLVPLLGAWYLSLSGIFFAQKLATLAYVPMLQFPAHARVHVGHSFSQTPLIRMNRKPRETWFSKQSGFV